MRKTLPELAIQHHGKTIFGPMQEWHTQDRFPPVVLLVGQPGIGKRSLAHYLSQWIFCEQRSATHPCSTCTSCTRFLNQSEVHFEEILPDSDSTSGTLKIEQFRRLKTAQGFGTQGSHYKIILIPNAERMTPQAANSVLKLLEEPSAGWIFFLTASDTSLLLPTIISRCQVFKLKPFPNSEIEKLLELDGIPQDKREVCARISQGSWNRALDFADDDVWEQRKLFFQFLRDPGSCFQSLLDWAAQDIRQLTLLLDFLEQIIEEILTWSASTQSRSLETYPWIHQDRRQDLIAHIERIQRAFGSPSAAFSFWLNRAERLARARQEIHAPLNRKIQVQDILLPWIEVAR